MGFLSSAATVLSGASEITLTLKPHGGGLRVIVSAAIDKGGPKHEADKGQAVLVAVLARPMVIDIAADEDADAVFAAYMSGEIEGRSLTLSALDRHREAINQAEQVSQQAKADADKSKTATSKALPAPVAPKPKASHPAKAAATATASAPADAPLEPVASPEAAAAAPIAAPPAASPVANLFDAF